MKKINNDFKKAVKKLEKVLKLKKTEIIRDSAIKRFEICFDLAWKVIKAKAKEQGLECYSPRQCFKFGFQIGLIDHDSDWLEMIKDRNLAIHLYSEQYANQIYRRLKKYLKLFGKLLCKL